MIRGFFTLGSTALFLCAAPTLLSCKGGGATGTVTCEHALEVGLRAMETINPGDDGGALPVVIRMYQLKTRQRLDEVDYASFWQDDRATLGDDLVERKEITLFPNGREKPRIVRKPEANYLAVVALFRRSDVKEWRRVFPLPKQDEIERNCKEESGSGKSVFVSGYRLRVEGSSLRAEPNIKTGG